jgi:Lon protease-like protein
MEQIGLFPLGIVLLPTERIPLHVFEPRYQELIGECLEEGSDFGLLYADDDGVREVGTRTRVTEVIERLDDGRLNILVEGGERFRVGRLTRGRSFLTAEVEPVLDEDHGPGAAAQRAIESFRALVTLAGAEPDTNDESTPQLSFALAAQVELGAEAKQRLLEMLSEPERLVLVAELFDVVRTTLIAARDLNERAKQNGSRLT